MDLWDPFSDERVPGLDPGPNGSNGNGANARQYSSYKSVFLETGHLKQEKTVQFRSVPCIAKMGKNNGHAGPRDGPKRIYSLK
jgi:hypothetical protein